MKTAGESDCLETLLDLICYEIEGRRLSFEMAEFLAAHLDGCNDCRSRMADYREAAFADRSMRPM